MLWSLAPPELGFRSNNLCIWFLEAPFDDDDDDGEDKAFGVEIVVVVGDVKENLS